MIQLDEGFVKFKDIMLVKIDTTYTRYYTESSSQIRRPQIKIMMNNFKIKQSISF